MTEWKPIPDWEDYYMASDEGEILGLPRRVACNKGYRTLGKRLLTPTVNSTGHPVVCLSVDGEQRTVRVCRLVAEAFLGKIPARLRVIHLDGNPMNNRVDNLAIGTSAESRYYTRPDRYNLPAGREALAQAKRMLDSGVSMVEVSRELGIPYHTVGSIASRDGCYKWLKEVD